MESLLEFGLCSIHKLLCWFGWVKMLLRIKWVGGRPGICGFPIQPFWNRQKRASKTMIPVLKGLAWNRCCDMDYFTVSMNLCWIILRIFMSFWALPCTVSQIKFATPFDLNNYMLFLLKAEYNYCVNHSHLGSHLTRGSPVLWNYKNLLDSPSPGCW